MNNAPRSLGILLICLLWNCNNFPGKAGSEKGLSESSTAKPHGSDPAYQNEQQSVKKSIAQTLQNRSDLNIEEQIALYHQLRQQDYTAYNFENEDEMTMYGYRYLWNDEPLKALEIFKLIVEVFPESSNPYDSLGEAYLVLGDSTRALENYGISLRLNPENFNAEDQIERIKNPNIKFPALKEKFDLVYTEAAYREDLDELGKKLLKHHPHALKFTSTEELSRTLETSKSLIGKKTTFAEFAWLCSAIIAQVKCSHTGMGSFYLESEMLPPSRRFPLQIRLIENQLFIAGTNHQPEIKAKDRIVAINGVDTSDLLEEIFRHIQTQGNIVTSKVRTFNQWAAVLIPYALGFPGQFEIEVASTKEPIPLERTVIPEVPVRDTSHLHCDNELCLQWFDQEKAAVLTLSTFNYYPWNNFEVFQEFLDTSFARIREKSTEKLIIDLRGNGGGAPEAGVHLLRYLARQPIVYFPHAENETKTVVPFTHGYTGKVIFLIDGDGKSTTGHVMALVKEHGLGKIVGEELGSNHFCTAGQSLLRLKNTRLEFYVANTASSVLVHSLPDDRGILPDYRVVQDIDDYLNRIDTVKNFAQQLQVSD